ncbi:MAG: hypothetical protein JXR68_11545 [Bacteroidales bacterium]|nr:hypothetical protein [Bacteroidales bacterium]
MYFKKITTAEQKKLFTELPKKIYKECKNYRLSNEEIAEWLSFENTEFHKHSQVEPFLIYQNNEILGRFTVIIDQNLPQYCQIAFLEFSDKTRIDLSDNLTTFCTDNFPNCSKILVGLNGHVNYGAGFLLNKYNQTPAYELPYTRDYYPNYFKKYTEKRITTFYFKYFNLKENIKQYEKFYPKGDFNVRYLNIVDFENEIKIYTDLNNESFKNHPYWTDRNYKEDYELFAPFEKILTPDNLIIIEHKNIPVGFLLWLPDFNQLLKNNSEVLKFNTPDIKSKILDKIDTFRLMEIAVVPKFQKKRIELILFTELMRAISITNYKYCEGGFIFNENIESINMSKKYLKRLFDPEAKIHRQYAVYENNL